MGRAPRYRQKLASVPLSLHDPVWIDDSDFDLSYHIRHAALPRPGDDGARFVASLLDQGIIDSTGVLELVTFLEDTYDIKVEDGELIPDNLDSINRLVRFLERKVPLSAGR